MSRKVIVTVAPTGGVGKKEHNPHLPTQPEEIAESIEKSWKAGASIAAIHARRADDQATCHPEVYRRINDLVREKTDVILNNSTGGGSDGDMVYERPDGVMEAKIDERLGGLEGGAEMVTFDAWTTAASFNGQELLVPTTSADCDRMAEIFDARGIKPEWEVFCPSHFHEVNRLIASGFDKPPYYINIVLGADKGFQGAMPYTPEILNFMVSLLPKESIFLVSGVGAAQVPATTHALVMGGHVRVGLEDNLMYSRGVHATNEMLVERQVRIIEELGLEVATASEARELIGLAPLA